jgi:hypothetical protein
VRVVVEDVVVVAAGAVARIDFDIAGQAADIVAVDVGGVLVVEKMLENGAVDMEVIGVVGARRVDLVRIG